MYTHMVDTGLGCPEFAGICELLSGLREYNFLPGRYVHETLAGRKFNLLTYFSRSAVSKKCAY